jgi:hypothetical protein
MSSEYTEYLRKQLVELRPYVDGEDMSGINVDEEDAAAGSPKVGDMIARNLKKPEQWLVTAENFAKFYVEDPTAP